MNRIKKLLQEHCPDGVEYIKLGELLNYEQPTNYIVKSTLYDINYKTPVLTAGQSFILGYTNETNGVYEASEKNPAIIFDDFTTSFHWVNFKFKVKSSAMKIIKPVNDETLFRYIYYAMKCINYKPQDHARQWISIYSNFQIPTPPLPVQQEIVNILDKFAQLEEELSSELEARRKQYEYYRDRLLTFTPPRDVNGSISDNYTQWRSMGEIGVFIRGNGLQKKDFTETGVGCIHYGQIYTYYGIYTYDTISYVSQEMAKKLRKAKKGDIVIAITSENIKDVCKSVVWLGEEEIAIGAHSTIFRHNQNPKYLAYYFQTYMFYLEKVKFARGTKVIEIKPNDLSKIQIPIPPLSVQERIVSILDKFDTLVNDTSYGIPAEIEARRMQYEYYRDKLLTFEELESVG